MGIARHGNRECHSGCADDSVMEAKTELLIWTAINLLLCIVVVNAVYRVRQGRLVESMDGSAPGALLREASLFIMMVGIPFLSLISGAAGLDLLALGADLGAPNQIAGFTFQNWIRGVGVTAAVITSVLVILWIGNRSAPRGEYWRIGWIGLRDAFYNEIHWTFYRAAPMLWLGDAYWGVIIGTVLALLEWFTHPHSATLLHDIASRQWLTVRLACLICSGFLFLATGNLWLMMAADLTIQLAASRLLSSPSSVPKQAI